MYCKRCGKKLSGTEKFCSECGLSIDYSDAIVSASGDNVEKSKVSDSKFDFVKSAFHLEGVDWDLEGYPIEDKKTSVANFDWASVLEGKEKKDAEERHKAIAMTEEDLYERIQSDRHNDEFDWDLVHTMKLDKSGRTGLTSLFREEDEELISTDFIPPLNTGNSYEDDGNEPQSRGTVVVDKIDKKKIEKFYTFNRKNEEFQALLDEEYERIKQKVQEETAKEESVPAAEELPAEDQETAAAETKEEPSLTREEAAKVQAEKEADEAERLAEEAERLAEEAEAKAKAAEEAAAKAAMEAAAAEEALLAKQREEEEEAARAAEEAAKAKAEEEAAAARAAEEAARAKAAAEEAAEKEKAAKLAAESAAVDVKLKKEEIEIDNLIKGMEQGAEEEQGEETAENIQKEVVEQAEEKTEEKVESFDELEALDRSQKELEAAVDEMEADMRSVINGETEEIAATENSGDVERKVSYGDIFEDEDDDYEDDYEKKGGCKTLFLDFLIVVLAIAVAITALLVFFPDLAISQRIRSLIPSFQREEVQPNMPDNTVAPEEDEEPEVEEPTVSDVTAAIQKGMNRASNIGNVSEDTTLLFASDKDYGMEGVSLASLFSNSAWYTSDSGDVVTYTDAVIGTVMEYYSKLMDKLNKDDTEVMDLIAEDSPLYGELNAISANSEIAHRLDKLDIGEIRANGSDFYVLVRTTEAITGNDAPEVSTKVVYLQTNDERQIKILNIVDVQ